MRADAVTRRFLDTKLRALRARSERLAVLTPRRVGLRRQDMPYAPSPAHFAAANHRLRSIAKKISRRRELMLRTWGSRTSDQKLTAMALIDRDVDRLRRTFGMLFEIFSQRGSSFAPALAAHDVIATDCYAAVRGALPEVFDGPLLKPLTYMEHGYSPATQRRGVSLARLLGDSNPFPVIRIPWDRDNPWQPVFLHEVAHNLQADMQLWNENATALARRLMGMSFDPLVVTIYHRWHKEIFADLAALLLGGTAATWGMMEFLAHPQARALTYRPGGAHPTGWFRVLILAEMMRRMGFDKAAADAEKCWRKLYDPKQGHRLPAVMLSASNRVIPAVVDEIAFQPRHALGQHALVDAIPFGREDEARIRRAAISIGAGRCPTDIPPRYLVSASRFALESGAEPNSMSRLVIRQLASLHRRHADSAQIPGASRPTALAA